MNKIAYEVVKVNIYAVKKTFQYAPVQEKKLHTLKKA